MRITVLSTFGRALALAGVLLLAVALAPLAAFAATDVALQPEGPVVTGVNIWLILLGAAAPILAYVLNHYLPHTNTQIKGLVQAVVAAGIGVVYTALSSGAALDQQTLVAAVEAMVAALAAHYGYKTAGINLLFGGGSNASGKPDTLLIAGVGKVVAPHAQPLQTPAASPA